MMVNLNQTGEAAGVAAALSARDGRESARSIPQSLARPSRMADRSFCKAAYSLAPPNSCECVVRKSSIVALSLPGLIVAACDTPSGCALRPPAARTFCELPETLETRRMLAGSPPLAWSSYLGGDLGAERFGKAITIDAAGSTFITGYAASDDALAMKVNANGTLAWATTVDSLGTGNAITTDSAGNVYIAGQTTSLQRNGDAFVTKFSATGQFAWTKYLGGDDLDYASGIAVSSGGQIYISGYTDSAGWVSGGGDTTFGGSNYSDAFVAKLASDGDRYGRRTWAVPTTMAPTASP